MLHAYGNRRDAGFTLIELMATLGILALIALIAVPAIGGIIGDAETESDAASVRMVESAARTASVAGMAHDRDTGYSIGGLVDAGYLDVPEDSKVDNPSARVEKIGHTYQYFSDHGIGGRNLLMESASWASPWAGASSAKYEQMSGKQWIIKTYGWGTHQKVNNLTVGETYTLSFYTYAEDLGGGETARYYTPVRYSDASGWMKYYKGSVEKDVVQRHTITFEAERTDLQFYFLADSSSQPIYFANPQLEVGDTATQWRPAPEDVSED